MSRVHVPPRFALLTAWLIFAFWGVIARAVELPLPLLLLLITAGGLGVSALFIKRPVETSWIPAVVASILVLDLLFLFLAFQRISFATSIALHYAGPVFVVLLSPIILRERFSWSRLVWATLGFAAVLVLCQAELAGSQPGKVLGVVFALLSSLTLAGNIIFQRLYMRERTQYGNAVFQYNLYMLLGYGALTLLWPLLSGERIFPLPQSSMSYIPVALLAGVLTQGIAMLLFNAAIRRVESQVVAQMAFSEVAMTIVLGAVIYSERLSLWQGGAVAVIVAVVYLAQKSVGRGRPRSRGSRGGDGGGGNGGVTGGRRATGVAESPEVTAVLIEQRVQTILAEYQALRIELMYFLEQQRSSLAFLLTAAIGQVSVLFVHAESAGALLHISQAVLTLIYLFLLPFLIFVLFVRTLENTARVLVIADYIHKGIKLQLLGVLGGTGIFEWEEHKGHTRRVPILLLKLLDYSKWSVFIIGLVLSFVCAWYVHLSGSQEGRLPHAFVLFGCAGLLSALWVVLCARASFVFNEVEGESRFALSYQQRVYEPGSGGG